MADRKEPTPAPAHVRKPEPPPIPPRRSAAEEALARLRDALDLSPFLSPSDTADVIIRRIAWLSDQIRDEEDA